MGSKKDISEIRKHLLAQGWEVTVARNGHYKCVAPDGRKCQIPKTPRNNTTILNTVTRLRRIGYVSP